MSLRVFCQSRQFCCAWTTPWWLLMSHSLSCQAETNLDVLLPSQDLADSQGLKHSSGCSQQGEWDSPHRMDFVILSFVSPVGPLVQTSGRSVCDEIQSSTSVECISSARSCSFGGGCYQLLLGWSGSLRLPSLSTCQNTVFPAAFPSFPYVCVHLITLRNDW